MVLNECSGSLEERAQYWHAPRSGMARSYSSSHKGLKIDISPKKTYKWPAGTLVSPLFTRDTCQDLQWMPDTTELYMYYDFFLYTHTYDKV